MKKTKCIQCGSVMGIDIGLGHFNNSGTDRKTKDGQWACSDRCSRDYNMALSQSGGNNQAASSVSQYSTAESEAIKAQAEIENRKLELEERRLRDEKEAREASERKEKGAMFRADGKPLTAFLVEMNPIYLLFGLMVYGCLFLIKIRGVEGILLKGAISTAGVLFLAFVIKDFGKLKGKAASLTIVGLLLIPVLITGWKAYAKSDRLSSSERELLTASTDAVPAETINENLDQTVAPENTEEQKAEETNTSVTRNENQIIAGNLNSFLAGEWKGDFGGKELLINLGTVELDLTVTGYDEVKGNRRDLTGEIADNGDNSFTITLKEPGDDQWDGVFNIKYIDGEKSMAGTWTANNGKSTKTFKLEKQ